MIALRRAQKVVMRFLNTAASANVKIDKCTTSLKENRELPPLEMSNFEPLFINEEIKIKVKNIVDEYNCALTTQKLLPSEVNLDIMKELLLLESRSQRIKYMIYVFKKEKSKLNRANKKLKLFEQKTLEQVKVPEPPNNHIEYGIGKTSLFMRFQHKSMNQICYLRQAYALLFGQNIVIDLDYENYMLRREIKNSASQLSLLLGANRLTRNPYNMHFCNAKPSSLSIEWLQKIYPCLYEPHGFVNCTELSYLDLFPKEKLVYLSPHASETLKHYDPTAVYIIGAFVDQWKQIKISHKKAEEGDIKSYALPIDEYIMWGNGSRSLSINQVFQIMLEMKNTNDWKKAFKFIPTRKIKKLDVRQLTTEEFPDKMYLTDHLK